MTELSTALLGRPALGFKWVTSIVLALALKFTRTTAADLFLGIAIAFEVLVRLLGSPLNSKEGSTKLGRWEGARLFVDAESESDSDVCCGVDHLFF